MSFIIQVIKIISLNNNALFFGMGAVVPHAKDDEPYEAVQLKKNLGNNNSNLLSPVLL